MDVLRSLSCSRSATGVFVLSESSLSTSADEDSSLGVMIYGGDSQLMKWLMRMRVDFVSTEVLPCTLVSPVTLEWRIPHKPHQ
ncbi:hypothetical protein HA466_0310480 [Hirschfeldia incana]|nr:hypothetical protein HA466_0310480 [Hirschfeldia incana]